jgi:hypothetical protein
LGSGAPRKVPVSSLSHLKNSSIKNSVY